jgi:hypothetical protein
MYALSKLRLRVCCTLSMFDTTHAVNKSRMDRRAYKLACGYAFCLPYWNALMIVQDSDVSIAVHCVIDQIRAMRRLSERIAPFVRTFAILVMRPNANKGTEMLDASSSIYSMAESSFWMVGNWFMPAAPLSLQKGDEPASQAA